MNIYVYLFINLMLKSIPKIFFIQISIIMLLLWQNYKTPSIQLTLNQTLILYAFPWIFLYMKKSKLIEFTRLFFGLLATCLLIKFNKAMLCWLFKYFCLLGTLDKKNVVCLRNILSPSWKKERCSNSTKNGWPLSLSPWQQDFYSVTAYVTESKGYNSLLLDWKKVYSI